MQSDVESKSGTATGPIAQQVQSDATKLSLRAPAIRTASVDADSGGDAVSEWSGLIDSGLGVAIERVGSLATHESQPETHGAHLGRTSAAASARWRRRDDVRDYPIEREGLIFDPRSHAIHHLNETAFTIWRGCDGQCATSLADALSKSYEVDQQTALAHVNTVLELLELGGLLAQGVRDASLC